MSGVLCITRLVYLLRLIIKNGINFNRYLYALIDGPMKYNLTIDNALRLIYHNTFNIQVPNTIATTPVVSLRFATKNFYNLCKKSMKKDIIKETKKGYEVEIQSISIKEDCLSIRFSTNEESNIVFERLKHIWIRSG